MAKPVDLQGDGLLWLVNRIAFHPRGYALGYDPETKEFTLLGDGTEPWVYDSDGVNETEYLAKVKKIMP